MMSFLDEHDVIAKEQFGFRPKFTTEYAILDIYEKLINNLDKSLTSCAIFLDLAKAFDTVSHEILLRKLDSYGFRNKAYDLLDSYLKNRYQFVKLDNTKSIISLIEFGVPQGSILGPLLFLLYINDLPNATNLFVKLYADDTFLCAQNSCVKLLEEEVNAELEKVYEWLCANKLTLNISKSKYMIVTKKRNVGPISVNINKSDLDECDSYKYLGVIFDKNLTWKNHIDHICGKINRSIGGLAVLRHRTNISVLREIYFALVNSYARYGILAWGNTSETNLHPLKTLLNKAIRIMSFAPYGPLDLEPIYQELGILNIDQTFLLERGKFMYKKKHNLLPTTIAEYFAPVNPTEHQYNLRSRANRNRSFRSNTVTGQKSIQNEGENLWKDLPHYLKTAETKLSFKKLYKSHLIGPPLIAQT